ncbi:MAG TPA: tRNA pseudouridine(38-40) synthase TruA [Anaeromyxobacteraceae bacterium]|nr:tRNA pseudouridine(38-40) synthase TruA [Anaeromyxobacteraceae bacterium]
MEKRRYALRLAYQGSAFRGFQRQPGLPTVQEALAGALAALGIRARLEAAARTDAGVHALGQVVGFAARADLDPDALRAAVNRETPPELLCLEARRVPPSFHARASAVSRRYLYLVGLPPPPGLEPYAWALPDERAFPGARPVRLDAEAMRAALAAAVGEHDFRAFARPGEQRGTVRTLERAQVVEASWAPLYAVVLEGRGFLRAMARNLVGTAVTVGLGLAPPSRLGEILAAGGRYRGVRAPGWGLTLDCVTYPGALAS